MPAVRCDDLGAKWTSPDGVVTYLAAKYYVTGYAGPQHRAVRSGHIVPGAMLLQSWAIGSAKDMEVDAWKSRIARGYASHAIVTLNGEVVERYGHRP